MSESFEALLSNPSLVAALAKDKITVPTEIQRRVIPEALKNKDLVVQSETGTGKTLAYLLPLFEKIDVTSKLMQAIILVPTHELAVQILRQVERLSRDSEIKVTGATMIGNVNIDRQIEKLKEKPHIIVGSPGRVLELIKKKKITAHTIKTIVLDEADRLLDDSSFESVRAVIKSTLRERQMMLFSATIPRQAVEKAKELMKEPEIIAGEEKASIPATIEHLYFLAEQRDKIEVLRKLVRIMNPQKALVFVNKSEEIDVMTAKLRYHGLEAEGIHGSNFKSDRKKTMEAFRAGKIQLLIASDVAARGLHIEDVTHIFNLSMPEDPRDYLHRAGRTGRNGNSGVAVSIVTQREMPLVRAYEKAFNIHLAPKEMYEGKVIDAGGRPGKKPVRKQPVPPRRGKTF